MSTISKITSLIGYIQLNLLITILNKNYKSFFFFANNKFYFYIDFELTKLLSNKTQEVNINIFAI